MHGQLVTAQCYERRCVSGATEAQKLGSNTDQARPECNMELRKNFWRRQWLLFSFEVNLVWNINQGGSRQICQKYRGLRESVGNLENCREFRSSITSSNQLPNN